MQILEEIKMKKPYSDIVGLESKFLSLYGEVTDAQKERYANTFNWFKREFNCSDAYVASSSGRVEVCGNHTDHNGGKVVSCAISLDTLAFFLPTENSIIHVKSQGYSDIIVDINQPENEEVGTSAALVRGVVVGLKERGYNVGGFNACLTSNVIGGAGISSSASFEVLIAEILNFLYNNEKIDQETKAIVAQFAENKYFGKPCGLLDQTAISFGGLKILDFSDKYHIQVTKIDNSLSEYTLILINTGGSHANLTDEYASIPAEMKQVAQCFGKERLIEISEDDFYSNLPQIIGKVSDRAINRAMHFYSENNRVEKLASALNENNYEKFLNCIKGSGISSMGKLQNCYVAGSSDQSIPRAIFIAEKYLNGGANRVHGGGFAGTTLNIVKNENVENFVGEMSKIYGEDCVIPLKVRSVGTIVL